MANEAFKQLVRNALGRQSEFAAKREQLQALEKQCQVVRDEFHTLSQAYRTAISTVMEESRQRYKNDRLIELDGLYYLIRVSLPHASEDSIVVLEPETVKER